MNILKPNLILIAAALFSAVAVSIAPLRDALLELLNVGLPALSWLGFLFLSTVWSINYIKEKTKLDAPMARSSSSNKASLKDYVVNALPALIGFAVIFTISAIVGEKAVQESPWLPLVWAVPTIAVVLVWLWLRAKATIKF